jgi:urocanate hydratase
MEEPAARWERGMLSCDPCELENDETLLVQSDWPVGVSGTHSSSPRVLIVNATLVRHWSNWDEFGRLDRLALDNV